MKKLLCFLFLLPVATAYADTYLGEVSGSLMGHGDSSAECCSHLSQFKGGYGYNHMMQKCREKGGYIIRNLAARGYCEPYRVNGPYKYECTAPAYADCYAF